MKINILPIKSHLHNGDVINNETQKLLREIESKSNYSFQVTNTSNFYDAELSIILLQSGGSEGFFLEIESELKEPFYLLTYGSNNSLAASMEILSYLQKNNKKAEILHGSASYISTRLNEINNQESKEAINLGVIGKPSDWLISSDVDYKTALHNLNIKLVDIKIEELTSLYNQLELNGYQKDLEMVFDSVEVDKAKKLSKALELLVQKYNLKGLTIRCFDLLSSIKTTGCLGLAVLNKEKIIGTCEGDIPAMLSMYLTKEITGQPGFQANPSRINTETNEIVFAHCTLPLDMASTYETMTYYESGIGVALRGKLKETNITIFKLSSNLKDYYVAEGSITHNLSEANLCRTQVNIQLDNVKYFLTNPYGNHHIIIYGKHKDEIDAYMSK
jgi:L-fucose isomerase-like protein